MKTKPNQAKYHDHLKILMDEFVNLIYDMTLSFPEEERFGVTSQIRRASLSVILNYIEGFARKKKLVMKNFLEISYGSLKETKYLLYFSFKRKYVKKNKYDECLTKSEEIGKMLWGIIKNI